MTARRFLVVILAISFALIQTFGVRTNVSQAQIRLQREVGTASLNSAKISFPLPAAIEKLARASSDTGLAPGRKSGTAHPATVQAPQGPEGDYGDAPDGSLAGYEQPYDQVIGRFPTKYYTTNSRVGRPGAHALTTGQEMLGTTVTREADVNDPNDPDGTPNMVDGDLGDDCLRIGFDPNDPATPTTIDIVVSVAAGAPATTRYVNVLADLNHDGVWQQFGTTEEWIIKNQTTNIAPGSQGVAASIPFDLIVNASPVWIRVVLSRDPINEADFASVGGWDGSGEFAYGEVEDHFLPVAKAIASAFASAHAAAAACASSSAQASALAQAFAVAQANVTAVAAAFATAQANAQAAAVAFAAAQASAQAAAAAAAQASSTASAAMSISVAVPCATLSVSMQATAQATAAAAAAASAQASAQAQAAAAAVAAAQAKAQAISVALANAQAAAAAIASASSTAQAAASACAAASASASASAQSAALAIALGGRSAYAAAVARAVATASAWATAQAQSIAIATAFASAQAFVQVSVTAVAVASAAAEASAVAAAAAQAAAAAAASASAAAAAAASTAASVLGSAQAVVDPNCGQQICKCIAAAQQVTATVTAQPGTTATVALALLTATPVPTSSVRAESTTVGGPGGSSGSGTTQYILVSAPGTIGVTINPSTGQMSVTVPASQAPGTYHVTSVAVNPATACVASHYDVAVTVPQ